MASSRGVVGLMVLVSSLAACAASDPEAPPREPLVLDENATLAPRETSDAAIVDKDVVMFPPTPATKAWAATLAPGRVIAGNRSTKTPGADSTNPRGFLRKVVAVRMGDPIVIETARADLADLLQGDLRFGAAEASIFADAPKVTPITTRTLRPLDDTSAGSGGNSGVTQALELNGGVKVNLHDGSFRFNAKFDGDFALRKKWKVPVGVNYASASLTLDPQISFKVDIDASASASSAAVLALGEPKKIDLGKIELFLAGPVPVTVEIGPVFECKAGVAGKIHLGTTTTVKGHFKGGFHYDRDSGTKLIQEGPSFDQSIALDDASGEASLMAACSVKLSVGVYAFDTLGIEGSFGPQLTFDAKVCGAKSGGQGDSAASVSRAVSLNAQLSAVAKVPFLDYELVQTTIFEKNFELYKDYFPPGNADTCKCAPKDNQLTCTGGS